MKVEIEKEEDGRWIAEVPALRGAMAYGATKKEAVAKVEALVLRALADKVAAIGHASTVALTMHQLPNHFPQPSLRAAD